MQYFLQPLCHNARDHIGIAARRIGHNEPHRACRPILGLYQRRRGNRIQRDEERHNNFHYGTSWCPAFACVHGWKRQMTDRRF